MSFLTWLVPIALGMGFVGLLAFLWAMKSGQLEDLDGAAARMLLNEAADEPLHDAKQPTNSGIEPDGGHDEPDRRQKF